MSHFDRMNDYDGEIPAHLRKYFLERKIAYIRARAAENAGPVRSLLDAGCGTGWHVAALRAAGYNAVGIDGSERQVLHARRLHPQCEFVHGSVLALPFDDGAFDGTYAVNTLHHLASADEQERAVRELRRVTKPGGPVIIHEMNTRNPLIRWYLKFLFPRLKSIDEGNELWIRPSYWTERYGAACGPVTYFTFTPDFLPRALLPVFKAIDRFLERTPARFWSAHYAVTLRFLDPLP